MTEKQVLESIPKIIVRLGHAIEHLYQQGARFFWIQNTGPIGCLPYTLIYYPPKPDNTDQSGCVKSHNEVAQEFNRQLKEMVSQLRVQLPDAVLTYVDVYSAKYSLINKAKKYGFTNPLGYCCGHIGDYRLPCGKKATLNGKELYGASSCSKPETYISWDAIHYSHAANIWIADRILNGSHSDPPIPVTEACHKPVNSIERTYNCILTLNDISLIIFMILNSQIRTLFPQSKVSFNGIAAFQFNSVMAIHCLTKRQKSGDSHRYSDGLVILDVLAKKLRLPCLSAYLDSIGTNFRHGANFATGGSTIQPTDTRMYGIGYSPISLDVQLEEFKQFKARTIEVYYQDQSSYAKSNLPRPEEFSKALYTIDIGQNDLDAGFRSMTEKQIQKSIPKIISQLGHGIEQLYQQGARFFWIHNTGPIGCLPDHVILFPPKPDNVDQSGCVKSHNEMAQEFNKQLKEKVSHLRIQLLDAVLTYIDLYSAKYALINEAEKYGFSDPLGHCCGQLGAYPVHCGKRAIVNGSETAFLMAPIQTLPSPLLKHVTNLLTGKHELRKHSEHVQFLKPMMQLRGLHPLIITQEVGLPYLSAYLDAVGSNFTHGANFATAGSTIRDQNTTLLQGGFSPISLNFQWVEFNDFKRRTQIFRKEGSVFRALLPPEEHFSRALYTFDIGQNDLTAGYFLNMTTDEVRAYVPDVLDKFSNIIKYIYDRGGRWFWIHNTGPVGCLPYVMDRLLVTAAQVDKAGCADPFNQVAKFFNAELKKAVVQLRKSLPKAAITYVDVYSVKYDLISNAHKHGFEHPLRACCGHGGKYNYNRNLGCGGKKKIKGKEVVVGKACKDPSVRINWDGVHYTEAANKWVFDKIKDGAYSDPPIPLNMACHRL
ncbi:GDSL lipase/esterase [Dillenia turbinata]|uniref:GDSL lipase/esterase n=1 Tax=Dillenia turbinata TaxID=194707 RepID=A0AAN8Z6F9_9MAGN